MGKATKHWAWLAAALFAFSALLPGCVQPPVLEPSTLITRPPTAPPVAANTTPVTLYRPSKAENEFVREVVYVTLDEQQSLLWSIVKQLIRPPQKNNESIPLFGGNCDIRDIRQSRDVVIVDFNGDMSAIPERTLVTSALALTNTLTELPNTHYVKILFEGKDLPIGGLLTTLMMHSNENLDVLWMLHKSYEESDLRPLEADNILLFFFDTSKKYLVCEARKSAAGMDNRIGDVLNEIKNGPMAASDMADTIPHTMYFDKDSSLETNDQGEVYAIVRIIDSSYNLLPYDRSRLILGGITLSLCSSLPQVSEVQFIINNKPLPSSDPFTPRLFNGRIGNIVTLYFPDSALKRLVPVSRAIPQENDSPVNLLYQLMWGPVESDLGKNIAAVFPVGCGPADLLGKYMEGNTLVLNFSNSFYTKVRESSLSADQERMLVYSIVNSLCGYPSVRSVRFLVAGNYTSGFGNTIDLTDPLIPNPGIVEVGG